MSHHSDTDHKQTMKLVGLATVFLIASVHCGGQSGVTSQSMPAYGKERSGKGHRDNISQHSGSQSRSKEYKRFAGPKPFLYGITYYPWRSEHKNCSQITESNIRDDFRFISSLARNVQIFDMYCNFTSTILQMTAAYNMGLLMGMSLADEADYKRQKEFLKELFDGKNQADLSHIMAITVGRTSMINETSKKRVIEKLQEISALVKGSSVPNIPVTIIDDSSPYVVLSKDPSLEPYFNAVKVISSRPNLASPDASKADDFFYGIVERLKQKTTEERNNVIYTELGYPSDIAISNSGKNGTDKTNDFFPPGSRQIHALVKLACIDKQPLFHHGPEPGPGPGPGPEHEPMPEPPPPPFDSFRYFYHSAFDMPFEFDVKDVRSHWGLAECDTREMKTQLKEELYLPGPPFGSLPFCSKKDPQNEAFRDRRDEKEYTRQWVAIGISLFLALLAVIALIVFLIYRHRQNIITQRKKMQQQMIAINSNPYIRTLTSYLNSTAGDSYVELISRSDYENLSALIGPEWLIDESSIQFEEIIGEGHFGIVQRATLSREGETVDVAVKRLHVGAKNVRQFLSEGILMEQFHHANVLPLIGISFTSYYLPMIITPFMEKGDLLSYVKNADNHLTVRQLLKFGMEISEGMRYMHDLKLIHRDLAARNCMLDDKLAVKIADFGLCRDISDSDSYQTARASDIPIRWMPPETIEKLEWTHKSDVWSYGVVLWELFTRGKQPYNRVPLIELRAYLKSGGRLQKPNGCPDVIYDLMKNCWHGQAEQRPTFSQLCEMVPSLVQALEREQILDVCDYYNSITVMEMVEQQTRSKSDDEQQERRPSRSEEEPVT